MNRYPPRSDNASVLTPDKPTSSFGFGQPTDVADLIALIGRSHNRWITGQNIHADGGLT